MHDGWSGCGRPENRTDLPQGIEADTERMLPDGFAVHPDLFRRALDRNAAAPDPGIDGQVAGLASAVPGTLSADVKTGRAAATLLTGAGRHRQGARMAKLREQAQTPRILLIQLRAMPIGLP